MMRKFIAVMPLLLVAAILFLGNAEASNPFIKKDSQDSQSDLVQPQQEPSQQQHMESEQAEQPQQGPRVSEGSSVGSGVKESSIADGEVDKPETYSPLRQLFGMILPIQRKLHSTISQTLREVERGGGFGTLLALLGGAFAYGLVHALGPGHGKSVTSAYFLARGGLRRHGLYMGMLTACIHAASAVVTVFAIRLVLEGAMGRSLEGAVDRLSQVSFLLIALIGLVMFVLAVRELLTGKEHGHMSQPAILNGFFKIAIVSGMIPCPGAAIILFFALSLGVPWVGLLAVVFMSLGMGVTISATGMLTLTGRGALLQALGTGSGWQRRTGQVLSLLGALLVMGLGLLFFGANTW